MLNDDLGKLTEISLAYTVLSIIVSLNDGFLVVQYVPYNPNISRLVAYDYSIKYIY